MSDTDEIFDNGEPEELIEVKKKNTRKPMSEERKQKLREQLKKARDAKKAKKDAGIVEPPKDPKASKVKKMLEADGEEPAVYVKAVKRKIVGKDYSEDIKTLKAEIASMKSSQGSDLDEVRALKAELKELRDIAKQYKLQQKEKKKLVNNSVNNNKNNNVKETKPNPYGELKQQKHQHPAQQPVPVKNIYSAYKKSIWSQFT